MALSVGERFGLRDGSHEEGIVQLDLKPANVKASLEGAVRIRRSK
jgi:hypothetical protein